MTEFLMGNQAIGRAARDAGLGLIAGYPGTPSTEVLEYAAKINDGSYHAQWSVNEKAALEVAAGASYCGMRTMVTCKQVGLNVAADPLMSLAYVGVRGGMVILVADDPGPISSQTEQDTRTFGMFSKVPVLDPCTVQQAYDMVFYAYELSEKYHTPVILRPTTRICHSCADVTVKDSIIKKDSVSFEKDPEHLVIFPKLSYGNHMLIEQKLNVTMSDEFSESPFNSFEKDSRRGIACSGVSAAYVKDILQSCENDLSLLTVGTPFPFPEKLAVKFLESCDEVLVLEELDPVLERALTFICGKYHLNTVIHGKLDGTTANAGENTADAIKTYIDVFTGNTSEKPAAIKTPELPVRPPVLCAGCPHRASFYAVKQAMKGKKAVFCGDIGCYTLGNAAPLNMVDTCLCMGADITIAQGIKNADPEAECFSFIGDSTFFASGITGVINAVYNQTDIIIIVLDNSTTAMTGQQPHPGTGVTMMGVKHEPVHIDAILNAAGCSYVKTVSPFDTEASIQAVKDAAACTGVRAVIFRAPCIAVSKPDVPCAVKADTCTGCRKCIREIGCPAISLKDTKAFIEPSLCTGCGLCTGICPVSAIEREARI